MSKTKSKTKPSEKEEPSGDIEVQFFDLDENQLDVEWKNQPKLYHEYAHKAANARAKYERYEANVGLVMAELDLMIREQPKHYDLEKVTEAGIKNTILVQNEYRSAIRKALRAKHKLDVIIAAVTALNHRKAALENLVELRLADYFSEPRARSEGSREAIDKLERRKAFRPIERNKDE